MENNLLWTISTFVLPLFFAIILHEIAHGFVAYKCGDYTAKSMGRLTLNPLSHIDPVGSILVPALLLISNSGIMFGWAKPVPVSFSALRDEKRDMGLVALAGPFMNFTLAILGVLCMWLIQRYMPIQNLVSLWLFDTFKAFFMINLALCAFNLLPILPLDGGRILVSVLPENLSEKYAQTERYGFFVLMGLLFLLPQIVGVDLVRSYMLWMSDGLKEIISFILKGILE